MRVNQPERAGGCCSTWWAVLGSNPWPLPCETEVGCLRINDMRAVPPIATSTCCHLISLDIKRCHDRTVPKLSQTRDRHGLLMTRGGRSAHPQTRRSEPSLPASDDCFPDALSRPRNVFFWAGELRYCHINAGLESVNSDPDPTDKTGRIGPDAMRYARSVLSRLAQSTIKII